MKKRAASKFNAKVAELNKERVAEKAAKARTRRMKMRSGKAMKYNMGGKIDGIALKGRTRARMA